MKVDGILLAFLDIPADTVQEYNRWYDLDHRPEHVSKADVLGCERYVATTSVRAVDGQLFPDFHAPYVTIYLQGGPVAMLSDEAAALWREKDRAINKQGRYWKAGRGTYVGRWLFERAVARPTCHVSEEAIPYLAHRGVIIAMGHGATPGTGQAAVDWWDEIHLPDLFGVDGILAAVRFRPAVDDGTGQLLHVLLCEDRPAEVLPRIEAMKRYAGPVGRFPPFREAYVPTAFVAHDRITPLDYDFEI